MISYKNIEVNQVISSINMVMHYKFLHYVRRALWQVVQGKVFMAHYPPGFTELTPVPILSTIPAPSWPGMKGKGMGSIPFSA